MFLAAKWGWSMRCFLDWDLLSDRVGANQPNKQVNLSQGVYQFKTIGLGSLLIARFSEGEFEKTLSL